MEKVESMKNIFLDIDLKSLSSLQTIIMFPFIVSGIFKNSLVIDILGFKLSLFFLQTITISLYGISSLIPS